MLERLRSPRAAAPVPGPPARNFSFTDWQVNHPTEPPPGDALDSNFDLTNAAVAELQNWCAVNVPPLEDAEVMSNDDEHAAYSAHQAELYANLAGAWAEHMPDTIPPDALAVEAITGDHWSSRWWANRANEAFGAAAWYYAGAGPDPPTMTVTGHPLPIGAIWFDTSTYPGTIRIWNGFTWATGVETTPGLPVPTGPNQIIVSNASLNWQLGNCILKTIGGFLDAGANIVCAAAAALTVRFDGGDVTKSALNNFTIDCGTY